MTTPDIALTPVYKIRDAATGLWETKGDGARFTKRGKVWTSRAAVYSHLLQYLRRDYHGHYGERNRNRYENSYHNDIGKTWEVVEITGSGMKTYPAREFIKGAPGWKRWDDARRKGSPYKAEEKCEVPCPTCRGKGTV